ncbi:NAD(P)/FAD-dependent oxidoreductase [Rhodococcoides corynebacterioides]|uniref:NAD(P)/FAD-dependent oxidoreductase n=1 Tax=Rhodococcoides corynebacterioides TaxID=53972 RepID=UPI001C9B9806|nr:FAD-dependent oxidoreductase [Rhodococcus corynebacterioides]MBY6364620.1 FAD-dependent oxidoreductase [Rhodococcus corynebacterioides]
MTVRSILVVGASLAGTTAVRELIDLGFDGRITLVGDEPHPPYQRPPLSKSVLAGDRPRESIDIAPLPPERVMHRLGHARALDAEGHRVTFDDGSSLAYDRLVVATGSCPRRLAPALDEFVLRSVDDALRLRDELRTASNVLVVGSSILGMEVASTCVALGLEVTVIDMAAPLEAVLGEDLADHFVDRATTLGCRFVRTTGPVEIRATRGRVDTVVCPDGHRYRADLVITCAGDVPCVDWLTSSGIKIDRGVLVDSACRTSHPDVVAAGDVTVTERGGRWVRSPLWANAVAQGRVAAATALGCEPRVPAHDPYFWTEQFGSAMSAYGPLPPAGPPDVVEGAWHAGDGRARWAGEVPTGVALGRKMPLPRLRRWTTDTGTATTASPAAPSPAPTTSHSPVEENR